jgi:FKBP-type peptidyl-prolyl cis-trans isomerase FklB
MSEVNLSTDETRVSYGIGRQLGDQLRDNPPPVSAWTPSWPA